MSDFEGNDSNESVEDVSSQPTETTESVEPNPFTQQETDNSADESGFNPAWNTVLNEIPSEFHNKVAPHLSEWDKNYQNGLEKARNEVQSQYEPFKQFLDNEIDPEELQRSYAIYQAINENPAGVVEALQQALGNDSDQGEDDGERYDPNDLSNNPEYQKLQNEFNQFREAFETQEQQKAYEAEQAEMVDSITNELEGLSPKFKEAFGFDMDPEEVLRIAIQNAEENDTEVDLFGAAQHFGDMISQYRQEQPSAPQNGFKVMNTSGGVPSTQQDVSKLSDEESKALMVQMLQQAQGGQ